MKKIAFHDMSLNYLLKCSKFDLFNICSHNLLDDELYVLFQDLKFKKHVYKHDYIHLLLLQLGLDNLGVQYARK